MGAFVVIKSTPYGIQTHNLQIRSLTRCSIAPTGRINFKPPRLDNACAQRAYIPPAIYNHTVYTCRYGLVGHDVRLTRERSPVQAWVPI